MCGNVAFFAAVSNAVGFFKILYIAPVPHFSLVLPLKHFSLEQYLDNLLL